MRSRRRERRLNRWRWLVGAASVAALLLLVIMACATAGHDPRYDGDEILPYAPADTVTLIRITIDNNRTLDALDPHFYLVGTGQHSLGMIKGMGGHLVRFIDASWIGPDGAVTIVAHYAGGPDLVFEKFYWRRGEVISVSLDNIFVPVAAWSHR